MCTVHLQKLIEYNWYYYVVGMINNNKILILSLKNFYLDAK